MATEHAALTDPPSPSHPYTPLWSSVERSPRPGALHPALDSAMHAHDPSAAGPSWRSGGAANGEVRRGARLRGDARKRRKATMLCMMLLAPEVTQFVRADDGASPGDGNSHNYSYSYGANDTDSASSVDASMSSNYDNSSNRSYSYSYDYNGPTYGPSAAPSAGPSANPSPLPTYEPSPAPSAGPSANPIPLPTANPSPVPTTPLPSPVPTTPIPSSLPSPQPSPVPSYGMLQPV